MSLVHFIKCARLSCGTVHMVLSSLCGWGAAPVPLSEATKLIIFLMMPWLGFL